MPILGPLFQRIVDLQKTMPKVRKRKEPITVQKNTLKKLLWKAQNTSFGKHHNFSDIYFSTDPIKEFQKTVPVFDYNKIHEAWWQRTLKGEEDVCWPGKIKYFALSSGTSEAASKYIPITKEFLRNIKRMSIRQILSLANYDILVDVLGKGFLAVGGSTNLRSKGTYFEGDLSGITARTVPFWFQQFSKPGMAINMERDWETKIEKIVDNAKDWDIGFIAGVPAWVQIVIEKVIARYNAKTIHDVWPNLRVFVHGGVSLEPYRKSFEKYFAHPIIYIDTYLASEGFVGFQSRPQTQSIQMILNNSIFFEFVPFTEKNFDADGTMVEHPETLTINDIKEDVEYALLMSTNAGAWRYLIGDTIKFTSKLRSEIVITGRTKQFLSLCGEHLSLDNMNTAIAKLADEFNVVINEFTVAGIPHNGLFAHKWFVGTNGKVDAAFFKKRLDEILCEINDDYAVERKSALKEIFVEILPLSIFHQWMRAKGKQGGSHKFPRVIKKTQLDEWVSFIASQQKLVKLL